MTSIARSLLHTLVATLALLLGLACGGDPEEPVAPTGGAESGEEVTWSGETEKGDHYEAQIGGEVEVPNDFPSDIPLYPESTPMATLDAGDHGSILALQTSVEPEEVFEFYRNELPNQGWAIENEAAFGDQYVLGVTKGERSANVTIAVGGGTTRVAIALTDE